MYEHSVRPNVIGPSTISLSLPDSKPHYASLSFSFLLLAHPVVLSFLSGVIELHVSASHLFSWPPPNWTI